MKKFLAAAAALLVFIPAFAQSYDPGHRSSIEISTGYAPYQTLSSVATFTDASGRHSEYSFSPNLNFAYCRALSYNWDFLAALNVSGSIYKLKYSSNTEAGHSFEGGFTVSALFRYVWYRNESIKLYSSFGVGISPWVVEDLHSLPVPIPLPSFSPIGINFGRGNVYGIAESTIGTSCTAWLLGIGYRF